MIGKVDEADGSNKRKLKSPASLLQPILLGKLRKEKSKTKTGNLVKNQATKSANISKVWWCQEYDNYLLILGTGTTLTPSMNNIKTQNMWGGAGNVLISSVGKYNWWTMQ